MGLVLWAGSMILALAQQPAPLTPKTPQPQRPPQTSPSDERAKIDQLKGILIVGAENDIKVAGPVESVSGVRIKAPEFLVPHESELQRELAGFFGKPIGTNDIKLIQRKLIVFSRRYESRLLDIVYLDTESNNQGIMQLAVVEGRTVISPEREPVPELRGILIVSNPNDIKPRGGVGTVTGIKTEGLRNILTGSEADLALALKDFLGQPFTADDIDDLRSAIYGFIEKMEVPTKAISVIVPEQEVIKGEWVVQVLVSVGEVGRLNIEEGKWFSERQLRRMVRLRQGDPVVIDRLVDDVNWINRNMFREANAFLRQGTNVGQVDVNLKVEDRFPLQVFAGAEDTLPETLDRYMWFAGFNWGKAFGLDHLLNYQFAAGFEFDAIRSHSGSYVAPLPWRHILTLGGAYAEFNPDLSDIGTLLTSEGEAYQLNAIYSVPLPRIKTYFHEMSAGFDYKHTDNNLLFGGGPLLTPTEIAQVVGGYDGLALDAFGRTRFQIRGVYSPGELFGKNTDEAFTRTHSGASADYYYLRFSGERVFKLPFSAEWKKREVSESFSIALSGMAQLSEYKLLPSEQIVFGGYDSVRGYDEFSLLADEGWKGRAELRSPEFAFGRSGGGSQPEGSTLDSRRAIRIQVLGFFDYGGARNFFQSNSEFDVEEQDLMSVGGGLRGGWSRHLDFRFDYGYQIGDEISGQDDHRAHFSVVAKF